MRHPKKWRVLASLSLRDCHSLQERHVPTGIFCETVTPTPSTEGGDWGEPRTIFFHPQDPKDHETFCEALQSAVALGLVLAWIARPYLTERRPDG